MMTQAAVTRAVETFATSFVVMFLVLASGALKAVNLNDHHAVWTALSGAAFMALVGALKEVTGFSALRTKPRA